PATRHTYLSAVNITRLPADVGGHLRTGEPRVPIKDRRGDLLESAIPKVTIVKDGNYTTDDDDDDPSREVDLLAQIERNLTAHPLAGFVVEGLSAYGRRGRGRAEEDPRVSGRLRHALTRDVDLPDPSR